MVELLQTCHVNLEWKYQFLKCRNWLPLLLLLLVSRVLQRGRRRKNKGWLTKENKLPSQVRPASPGEQKMKNVGIWKKKKETHKEEQSGEQQHNASQ